MNILKTDKITGVFLYSFPLRKSSQEYLWLPEQPHKNALKSTEPNPKKGELSRLKIK